MCAHKAATQLIIRCLSCFLVSKVSNVHVVDRSKSVKVAVRSKSKEVAIILLMGLQALLVVGIMDHIAGAESFHLAFSMMCHIVAGKRSSFHYA